MTRESCLRGLLTSVVQVALLCTVLAPRMGWSQANSATFHGTVTDPTGAVVPRATVTLTNEDTQAPLVTTTGDGGDFAFTFVPAGVYTLRIELRGFKSHISTGIRLTAGQQARQSFAIDVGEVTETVTVEGAAQLVNTVSA